MLRILVIGTTTAKYTTGAEILKDPIMRTLKNTKERGKCLRLGKIEVTNDQLQFIRFAYECCCV